MRLSFIISTVILALFLWADQAHAVNCVKKPDHPSCDGGVEPPPGPELDAAYAYEFAGSIYLMNEDGSAPTLFLERQRPKGRNNPGTSYGGPEWSPDGDVLAYTKNATLEWISLDGSGQDTLYADSDAGIDKSWRFDGAWIAFPAVTTPGRDDILASNGGPAVKVTEDLPYEPNAINNVYGQPSWSADGTHIAFRQWAFWDNNPTEKFDILICGPIAVGAEPNCDSSNTTVWRAFSESYFVSPVWHPIDDVIAYVPQGVEMFIESVDNSACIQLYNSNPNRTAPVLRPDCIAKDVGDFYFGGDFDWSCDGNSLIVTGNFDTSGDWGIHRIDNIFDTGDLNLTDNIASLVTVDSNTNVPNSPASRCTP